MKWSSASPFLCYAQGGGRLEHESIGDAIYTLNKKLKVNNIVLKGMKYKYKYKYKDNNIALKGTI